MLTNKEIQNLVMLELLAPEDPEKRLIPEEESEQIRARFEYSNEPVKRDWAYILKPISDPTSRSRFIQLLQALDNE